MNHRHAAILKSVWKGDDAKEVNCSVPFLVCFCRYFQEAKQQKYVFAQFCNSLIVWWSESLQKTEGMDDDMEHDVDDKNEKEADEDLIAEPSILWIAIIIGATFLSLCWEVWSPQPAKRHHHQPLPLSEGRFLSGIARKEGSGFYPSTSVVINSSYWLV